MGSVNSKEYTNRFYKGLDQDTDPKFKKPETYYEGHHIQVTGDEKYGAVQNMLGTTLVQNIPDQHDYYNAMGYQNIKALIISGSSGTIEDCVLYFVTGKDNTGPVYTFHIYLFRVSTGLHYSVYEEIVTSSYMSASVDSIVSTSAGIDTVYYTSTVFEPKRIRCYFDIASSTKTQRETELFRRYPGTPMIVDQILYNPKETEDGNNIHHVYFDQTYTYYISDTREWHADILLDYDTGDGDEFNIVIYYILEVVVNGGGYFGGAAYIDVEDSAYPTPNSLLSDEIIIANPGSYTYQNKNSTVQLNPPSGSYTSWTNHPYVIKLKVEGSGEYYARAYGKIQSISEEAGGDFYGKGTPTIQTEELTKL